MAKETSKTTINDILKELDVLEDVRTEVLISEVDGKPTNRMAVVGADSNHIYSVVSDRYNLVSNKKLIESFEKYLKDSDVKYQRVKVDTFGKKKQRISVRYNFPEISASFGTTGAIFDSGVTEDKVMMSIEIQNSYDGSCKVAIYIGGFRLVCANGLRSYDNAYKFAAMHSNSEVENIDNLLIVNFETAKEIFLNGLCKTWQEFQNTKFDKKAAGLIFRSLELNKRYKKILASMWLEEKEKLQTMWDFYNVITWFTTHYVSHRNKNLAQNILNRTMSAMKEQ